MAASYNPSVAKAFVDYLNEMNIKFSFDQERGLITFKTVLDGKLRNVSFDCMIDDDSLVTDCKSPISGNADDPESMDRLYEFFNRVNYSLLAGHFVTDHRDGEILYRYFIDCSNDTVPSNKMMTKAILVPLAMMEKFSPGFLKVIFGDADPAVAYEECEAKKQ